MAVPPLIARLLSQSDRRVARQTLWMGGIMVVQLLGGLAQISLSARILGPEGFGVLAIIIAAASIVHGLIAMPGGEAVTTFVTRSVTAGRPEEAARILRFTLAVSLGLSLVAYAVIAALALAASATLGLDPAHTDAALLYGVVGVLIAAQSESLAVLRLADRVSLGLAVTMASVLTRVGLIAAAWLTDGGLAEVVLAYVVGSVVEGAGMLIAAAVSVRHTGLTGFLDSLSIRVTRDVVQFQAGVFGRTAMGALNLYIDSILVAQLAGAADLGLYRAARQIMDMTKRPFKMIQAGVKVEYSRQWYSRQGAALRRTSLRFTLLSLALAALGYGLLAIFGEHIIRIILGDDFIGSINPLLIMIIGTLPAVGILTLSDLTVATGRVWPSFLAGTMALATSVAAILWLTPQYGAMGAAWGYTTQAITFTVVLIPFIVSILRRSRQF